MAAPFVPDHNDNDNNRVQKYDVEKRVGIAAVVECASPNAKTEIFVEKKTSIPSPSIEVPRANMYTIMFRK